MISRAARLPRICLACRASLAQRSAVLGFRALPRHDGFSPRRRFASNSDPPPQFNAETEAMISEKLWGPKTENTNVKGKEKPKDPDYVDEDEADWDSALSAEMDRWFDEVAGASPKRSQQEKPFPEPRGDRDTPTKTADEQQFASFSKPRLKPRYVFSSDSDPVFDLPESNRPGSQPRVFRHSLLHNQPLGVQALGVPADAIIINNPNKMRSERRIITREMVEKPLVPTKGVDWRHINSTDGGDKIEARGDIRANLNELRPDTRSLRIKDFQKLCDKLVNGFTTRQLGQYFRRLETDADSDDAPLANYPWIEKQTAWTPFNPIEATTKVTKQMAHKYSLVQKFVTQKWKVSIQEHEDALGQAFVWIDPHYFKFISHGGGSFLKGARNHFLDKANNEKLSTTSSECRLNITSRKASTYAILERLDHHLKNVHHRMIPIGQITKQLPTDAELRELAGITGTYLELRNRFRESELDVSWFDEKKPPRHANEITNENNADTVLRLLTTIPIRGSEENVDCIPPLDPSSSGLFVGFNRELRSMAWRDKLRKWLRYVAPVDINPDASEAPLDLANSTSLKEYAGKLSVNVTTATFGHILHSEAHESTDTLSRRRRLLSPVTPHPASFSALKTDYGKAQRQSTAIILKFAPYRDLSMSKRSHGPPVRLHIPITPQMNTPNFTIPEDAVLQCAIPWQVDDVMLPTESVDVRLVSERHLPLDINQAPLQKFLKTSRFNLSDCRFQTPAQVVLSIPEQWINPRSRGGKTSEATVDVLYAFRGIEIRQIIEMPLQGATLRYSHIEAGQHGGRRQELTLQAGPPGALEKSFRAGQRKSFLQTVEDIVTGKYFSWSEGHKSAKKQQYDDFSYDLPAEELGDDFVVTEFDPEEERKTLTMKRAEKLIRDRKLKMERTAAKVAARKKGAMFSLLLNKAEQPSETAIKSPTGESAEVSATASAGRSAKGLVGKVAEMAAGEPTTESAGELWESLKPMTPTTLGVDENDFFRHFSARVGAQLDRFNQPPQLNSGKRGGSMRDKDVDEDDPFRITHRPKGKTISGAEYSSTSTRQPAGRADSVGRASGRASEEPTFEDEWEDDEIEDYEKTTAEIEAELVRMLSLDKKYPAADASAQAVEEDWEAPELEAAPKKTTATPPSSQDAQAEQRTEAAGSDGESASPEKAAEVLPEMQPTNADETLVNKNEK